MTMESKQQASANPTPSAIRKAQIEALYNREEISYKLRTDWELGTAILKLLRYHFLREWHTANLLVLTKDGFLNYGGDSYRVVFLDGKEHAIANSMCQLYFRRPHSNLLQPIVLVKQASAASTANSQGQLL